MAGGSDEYAPLSLPNDFKVVRVSAEELDLVKFQRDVAKRKGRGQAPEIVDFEQLSLPVSRQAGRGKNSDRIKRPRQRVAGNRLGYGVLAARQLLRRSRFYAPVDRLSRASRGRETAWTILVILALPLSRVLVPLAAMANPAIKCWRILPKAFCRRSQTLDRNAFNRYPLESEFSHRRNSRVPVARRVVGPADQGSRSRGVESDVGCKCASKLRSREADKAGVRNGRGVILMRSFRGFGIRKHRIVRSTTGGRPCDDCQNTWEHVQFYYLALGREGSDRHRCHDPLILVLVFCAYHRWISR